MNEITEQNEKFCDTEISEYKLKIITATGQDYMDVMISNFSEFNTVAIVDYKEDLLKTCEKHNADILVITDSIGGKLPLINVLLEIKSKFNNIRIVYFCGKLDYSDNIRINNLNSLISVGIYDIVQESTLNDDLIKFRLKTPMTKEQNDIIISKISSSIYGNRKLNNIEFIKTKTLDDINSSIYPQLFSFISTKNGTGSTFIISNVAVAIANMGLNNINGNKPKVALIDLDIAGFNLSNNFDTLDNDKNLLKAVEESKKIITEDGLIDNKGLQAKVIDNIKKMLIPTKKYSNIKILCGPKNRYEDNDLNFVTHDNIVFILETIADDYDVILVDCNSDIEFSQIFPLFSMSKDIYSTIEMSFNSFNNNNRLDEHISQFLSSQKIKYVLNKELIDENIILTGDDFKDFLDYNFVARIPYINPITIFNTDYEKNFIINKTDKDLLKTRFEIIKLANNIWPIKNYDKLAKKMGEIVKNKKDNKEDLEEESLLEKIFIKLGFEKEEKDNINDIVKENALKNKIKNFNIKQKIDVLQKGIQELGKNKQKNIESFEESSEIKEECENSNNKGE